MKIFFSKYQGTGNDFILIDGRKVLPELSSDQIKKLCDRRFGVGADGLMILKEKAGYDFEMVYFNSDGNQGSMCGNGARCIVNFAAEIGLVFDRYTFWAPDGEHEAERNDKAVKLKMNDVSTVEKIGNDYFLNTGSPHYVRYQKDLKSFPVFEVGKQIRYNERFREKGTNVNFIENVQDSLFVRTYERGVEDETYSCGTGVTAAALVHCFSGNSLKENECAIKTIGGELKVYFNKGSDGSFNNIWLEGPAEFVFHGETSIE